MANDIVVTLPTANGGNIDIVGFDILGNGTIYEWTVRSPSIGGYLSPPARAAEGITFQATRKAHDSLLAGNVSINVNITTFQSVFTCPATSASFPVNGCIITKIVLKQPSLSLTTVSVSGGWVSGNNTLTTATHTELTAATLATPITPTAGQQIGLPGQAWGITNTIAQGAAGTVNLDLFGYLF